MSFRHNQPRLPPYSQRSVDISPGNGPVSNSKRLVYAAFILATIGQFMLLVLIAMLLRFVKERRSASMLSLLITTLVSSIPPYLLVYGNDIWRPDSLGALCVAQAYLLAGSPTMLATALWPAVLDTLVESRTLLLQASTVKFYRIFLFATPYVTFLVFCGIAAVLNQIYPNQVNRHPLDSVCSLDTTSLHIVSQILSVLALLTALCLEMYVLLAVLRPRRFRTPEDRASASHNPCKLKAKAVRIISFACLQAVVLIASALSSMPSPALHVTTTFARASIPLAASVTVATLWTDRVVNIFKRRSQESLSPQGSTIQVVEVKITIETSVHDGPIMIHLNGLSYEKGGQGA